MLPVIIYYVKYYFQNSNRLYNLVLGKIKKQVTYDNSPRIFIDPSN